jgi:hypothetical protein
LRKNLLGSVITLIVIILLALVAFIFAYQIKPAYFIDIGTRLDQAYLVPRSFFAKEPPEDKRPPETINYRWTRAESQLIFSGVGAQDFKVTLHLLVSDQDPNPALTILVNGQTLPPLTLPPKGELKDLEFSVPANLITGGNLNLTLKSNTWKPRGDSRELGIYLDWVKLEPAGSGFVAPPFATTATLLVTLVLFGILFLAIGLRLVYVAGLLVVIIVNFCVWLSLDRLSLTALIAQNYLPVLIALTLITGGLVWLAPPIYRKLAITLNRVETGWLAFLFFLYFALLYIFMIHPQFSSSDIGLNVNRLLEVRSGKFVFALPLPDGQLAPYPPAYYFVLLPFSFGADSTGIEAIIKFGSSFFQATALYLIFYLASFLQTAKTHKETFWLGIIAAATFLISRYPFFIFSQGNHTNLFAAWIFLLFICLLTNALQRQIIAKIRSFSSLLFPVSCFLVLLLVFLSHYGTFLFTNAFLGVLVIMFGLFGGVSRWRKTLFICGIWFAALTTAFLVYYLQQLKLIGDQIGRIFNRTPTPIDRQRPPYNFFTALQDFIGDSRGDFGTLILFGVAASLAIWLVSHFSQAKAKFSFSPFALILMALTVTAILFGMFGGLVGQTESRYQLYLLVVVALGSGYFFAKVGRRGFWGVAVVVAVFIFQLTETLAFWLDRVTYYF